MALLESEVLSVSPKKRLCFKFTFSCFSANSAQNNIAIFGIVTTTNA